MDSERQIQDPVGGSSETPIQGSSSTPVENAIPTLGAGEPTADDETLALKLLTENVRDQDDLERDITLQANRALIEAED